MAFFFGTVNSTAPCGLSHNEHLIVSYLKIKTSRFCDSGSIGTFYHFRTVRCILYFKAYLEAAVAPYLIAYDSARFLRRKYKMNAKASAYSRRTDKLFHKFGLL